MYRFWIDSRDRTSGVPADFSITLPQTLSLEGNHRFRVDSLRVPQTIPTIQTGMNDTFVVWINGTYYPVTLPQGQYDGPGLAAALQGLLNGTIGTWTCTYNTANMSLTVMCSYPYTLTGGTFADQLKQNPYSVSAASITFTDVFVTGIDQIYLCSPQFSTLDMVGPSGAHDVMLAAPVTCPYGSVLVYDSPWAQWFPMPPLTTNELHFQLRDRNNRFLTGIPNWSFVLLIE